MILHITHQQPAHAGEPPTTFAILATHIIAINLSEIHSGEHHLLVHVLNFRAPICAGIFTKENQEALFEKMLAMPESYLTEEQENIIHKKQNDVNNQQIGNPYTHEFEPWKIVEKQNELKNNVFNNMKTIFINETIDSMREAGLNAWASRERDQLVYRWRDALRQCFNRD